MPTNIAKPRAKTAHSSPSKRRASISSPTKRASILRRSPLADVSASAAAAQEGLPGQRLVEPGRSGPQRPNPPKQSKLETLKRYRNKPILIGQALRRQGFDEYVAAAEYISLAEALSADNAKVSPARKMRFDVLKELTRQLEAAQKAERTSAEAAAADAPVMVQLVHAVPRPERAGSETLDSKKEPS